MVSNLSTRPTAELSADGSNAVLVCHALSGNHHAAGFHSESDTKPGWWDTVIGPGKPIDTNRFFVVCPNNIGGCDGSTGPAAYARRQESPGGPHFPQVTVADWVETQKRLAEHLDIRHWAAVIGGSLGGMQALEWSVRYPDWVSHCVAIAAAPGLTAQNIAFNEIADRQYFQTLSGTMEITWRPTLTRRRAWHWRVWWVTSPICPPTR